MELRVLLDELRQWNIVVFVYDATVEVRRVPMAASGSPPADSVSITLLVVSVTRWSRVGRREKAREVEANDGT